MVDKTTGAMQQFGSPASPGAGGPMPGLVLLYAENFASCRRCGLLDRERLIIGRDDAARHPPAGQRRVARHAEIAWEPARGCSGTRAAATAPWSMAGADRARVELEPLSEVRIGDAILKFVDRHADAYADYRIDGALLHGAPRAADTSRTALVGGYQMDRIAADSAASPRAADRVMLLGESGTGKEVVARELHRLSGRRGSFCAVNCAAIPGTLIESELFGYKRGAFSGADRDKPGLIRAAHDGTLLLDEIGDMPLEAQAKLLRVLQSKEVFPLGATQPETVDVRDRVRDAPRPVAAAAGGTLPSGPLRAAERVPAPLAAAARAQGGRLHPAPRTFLARHGRPDLGRRSRFMTAALHYDWPLQRAGARGVHQALRRAGGRRRCSPTSSCRDRDRGPWKTTASPLREARDPQPGSVPPPRPSCRSAQPRPRAERG